MKHILPINEGWAFVKGCETAPAAIPAGAARVDLPHCWNALDGQDGGSDYWRGPCCYLKTIEKPAGTPPSPLRARRLSTVWRRPAIRAAIRCSAPM